MAKATKAETKKRIAKEITDRLRTEAHDSHLVFAEARRERQFTDRMLTGARLVADLNSVLCRIKRSS